MGVISEARQKADDAPTQSDARDETAATRSDPFLKGYQTDEWQLDEAQVSRIMQNAWVLSNLL